jgi:hypothetical protein
MKKFKAYFLTIVLSGVAFAGESRAASIAPPLSSASQVNSPIRMVI